jgi:D-tyrosyl-tRNA(Tyr) deacylase
MPESTYHGAMRAVLQRVSYASVSVAGEVVGHISQGAVVLVGVANSDTLKDAAALAAKIIGLRVFPDTDDRMNLSLTDNGGSVLLISQFTLLADVRRGRRPSFTAAAAPAAAAPLIEGVAEALITRGIDVVTGVFGAKMDVQLVNVGPVTITIDVRDGRVV